MDSIDTIEKGGSIVKLNKYILEEYLGEMVNQYIGYSNDFEVRESAASGGIVSEVLIYLLDNNLIDGALVSKLKIQNNKITPEVFVAKTREQILDARTSIYFSYPLLQHIDLVKNFEGQLAIVGLPCQISAIKYICDHDKKLDDKIVFKVGLFCGHASKRKLLESYLQDKNIKESDITKFIFRKGHWRGKTYIYLKNDDVKVYPFQDYSIYQNLYFYSEKFCMHCSDHTAEFSDISIGDVWDHKFKKLNTKHSLLLTRNKHAQELIAEMIKMSKLTLNLISKKDVFIAQKRSLIFHKNVNARSIVGKYIGFDIQSNSHTLIKTRLNDLIAALIILTNVKLSTDKRFCQKFDSMIFKLPKPILFCYLVIFKILTNY